MMTRKKYDYIVYDTPPIAIIADAGVFASKIGVALMVVRANFTLMQMLEKAYAILLDSGVRVAGVALNASKESYDKSYYKYYRAYRKD